MLGLLEKVTLGPDHVTSADVQPVLATGVSRQAIEEALFICTCFNIIARLADAFDVAIPSAAEFTQTGIRLIEHGYV
ncbi:hypothetical protein KTT_56860 [Tengunoibacter tsumagoiensis]|uniref:Carboxymuconolactone decarboxylase-like domain-containing protein n=1 Tax=Tengunoibacter tsumagoiensis TaxID=2014871 RepID=A0A402A9H9_9CHLR|nr:hypothetical protein KTT_56860 [Tengunoibacter tsumagoiensis]